MIKRRFAISALALFAGFALCGPTFGGCQPSGTSLADNDKEEFLQNPNLIMTGFGSRIEQLAVQVSGLARSGRSYLDALKIAMASASAPQRIAIGKGIFLAVSTCRFLDDENASHIEAWAKTVTDSAFLAGYRRTEYMAEPNSMPTALPPLSAKTSPADPDAAIGVRVPKSGPVHAPTLELTDPFQMPEP